MNLLLQRIIKTSQSTEGKLFIDEVFFSYTLEPVYRERPNVPVSAWKVFGSTAIPVGTYNVEVTYFYRDQYYTPLLDNVPGFSGVRIHAGNFPKDTEGCILVGTLKAQNEILNSKVAFDALMTRISIVRHANQPIQITVQNAWETI
ncbi:DUF5675 family protein [Burkholderia sp. BCC1988]|uniref:DUF5675 family protein n=1 Tax=Burkholderia sp. BCC1988 TaxID=2817443 RepID=UPI002AB30704|nr:DUF5675 family protein [Burkholderia sp. BCC1988]